jgi:hypothetical protein
VADLKHLVLKTLFEWVSASWCFSCSNFSEFLDLYFFSGVIWMYVLYDLSVHNSCLIFLINFLSLIEKIKNKNFMLI